MKKKNIFFLYCKQRQDYLQPLDGSFAEICTIRQFAENLRKIYNIGQMIMLCKVYVEKFKSEIKEQQERKEKR